MKKRCIIVLAIVAVLDFAGCAGTGSSLIVASEKDALLVDQSFIRIANLIVATPGEPANVVSIARALTNGSNEPLDLVQQGLQALIAGSTPPPAVATFPDALALLDTALADLAPIAANFGPQATTALIAAEVLLTTAETIAGAQAPTTTAKRQRTAHAASSGMTPDTARRTLQGFLAH